MALTTTALAGGFQRGTADTDILYESGPVSMRTSLIYVNPMRGFDSINGQSGDFGDYTQAYNIPTYAIGFGGENFGCAGTYIISFAAESDYTGSPGGALPPGPTARSRTLVNEFDSNEFGMTCRASYSSDMGRFSLLGGAFAEDFNFTGTSASNTPIGVLGGQPILLPVQTSVDTRSDYSLGYRIGAAYEKPEIALRAQVLYRSEVTHDTFTGTGTVAAAGDAYVIGGGGQQVVIPNAAPPVGTPVAVGTSSFNEVTSPQSLYINAQTGIAEGTLLLASFRWTDWSTNKSAISSITTTRGTSSSVSPYNWRDGYTASIGIGRAFNEEIAGAISIGYDRGVSTGSETTYTDLYTVAGGLSFKANKWSEIRVGGLVGYWTDGEQSISDGAYFNATVGDDIVLAGNASIKLNF
ncbi:long-chain fatty acid transporter [Aurantimonas marina]|uniref:long-chain fatty acid transporter n=1 Tax=Aurantimonas marina TaxID=2780508 RepID=UPI001E62CD33|nr:long-chain fatty acid transporter [Aurantimonas marina]